MSATEAATSVQPTSNRKHVEVNLSAQNNEHLNTEKFEVPKTSSECSISDYQSTLENLDIIDDRAESSKLLETFFEEVLEEHRRKAQPAEFATTENQLVPTNADVSTSSLSITSPSYSTLTNLSTGTLGGHEQIHVVSLDNLCDVKEPNSYKEALTCGNHDEWKQAIEELKAHEVNETWKIVEKPHNIALLTTRWIFKCKTKQCNDGSIERFKARLVARGYEQEYGVNYVETFSPVASYNSIRVLLALAS